MLLPTKSILACIQICNGQPGLLCRHLPKGDHFPQHEKENYGSLNNSEVAFKNLRIGFNQLYKFLECIIWLFYKMFRRRSQCAIGDLIFFEIIHFPKVEYKYEHTRYNIFVNYWANTFRPKRLHTNPMHFTNDNNVFNLALKSDSLSCWMWFPHKTANLFLKSVPNRINTIE